MSVKLSGKEELCRNLEQQINELKQSAIKYDSEISQLRKTISSKDEAVTRLACTQNIDNFLIFYLISSPAKLYIY